MSSSLERVAEVSAGGPKTAAATLTHLQRLEAESIQIFREIIAECENPVMLYSIGKDSAVMLHLATKQVAHHPGVTIGLEALLDL